MIWRTVVALAFLPAICWAQSFERYQAKTLDAVFDEWNDLTKTYEVGLSVIQPQKIRFVATYRFGGPAVRYARPRVRPDDLGRHRDPQTA
jgi:hypothetical protein